VDLATLLGFIGAFGVIIGAIILGGSAGIFFNVPSLIIVVLGTFTTTLMQISLPEFLASFKIGIKSFMHKELPPEQLIEEAVELANVARKEGILALEGRKISDDFLATGIRMCIDGHAADVVQKMLSKEINLDIQRQLNGVKMFKSVEAYAPAMGMIGTLIGLVQMLANMDDPKSIGPAMAVALLTTLYGAIIANAIAGPIAAKLTAIAEAEKLNKQLILESVNAIQEGTNPRVLKQMLTAYLPAEKRDSDKKKK